MNNQQIDTIIIELRAGEGGADAKLLVLEQVTLYRNVCNCKQL